MRCAGGELTRTVFEWRQTFQERNRGHSCSSSQSCQGCLPEARSTCWYSLRTRNSSVQQSLHRTWRNNVIRMDQISRSPSSYTSNFIYALCTFFFHDTDLGKDWHLVWAAQERICCPGPVMGWCQESNWRNRYSLRMLINWCETDYKRRWPHVVAPAIEQLKDTPASIERTIVKLEKKGESLEKHNDNDTSSLANVLWGKIIWTLLWTLMNSCAFFSSGLFYLGPLAVQVLRGSLVCLVFCLLITYFALWTLWCAYIVGSFIATFAELSLYMIPELTAPVVLCACLCFWPRWYPWQSYYFWWCQNSLSLILDLWKW